MEIDLTDDGTALRQRPWPVLMLTGTAVFVVSARLASLWELDVFDAQPFWPSAGLILALAIATPRRHRFALPSGGLVGQAIESSLFDSGDSLDVAGHVLASGLEMFGTLAVLMLLLDPRRRFGAAGSNLAAFPLCFLIIVAASVLAAVWFDPTDTWTFVWHRSLGNFVGLAAFGPLGMIPRGPRTPMLGRATGRTAEFGLSLLGTAIITIACFSAEAPVAYFILAVVLWLAVRFGSRVSMPTAIAVSIYACLRTAAGEGPFSGDDASALLSLEGFLGILVASAGLVGRYARALDRDRQRNSILLAAQPDLVTVRWGTEAAVSRIERIAGVGDDMSDAVAAEVVRALQTAPQPGLDQREPVASLHQIIVDGRQHQIESRAIRVDRNHVVTISRDMTEMAELVERLQNAENRLQRVAATGYEGFIELDRASNVVYVTDRFAELLGASADELLGQPLSSVFEPGDWQALQQYAGDIVDGKHVTLEANYQRRDGERAWALVSAEPIVDEEGAFDGAVMFAADTSAYHEAMAGRALAELQLAAVEHVERQRIARALHDGPLQSLVALSYQLNALANGSNAPAVAAKLEALTLDTIKGLRGSLEELVPSAVSEGRLEHALRAVAEPFGRPDGPRLTIHDRIVDGPPADVATTLFHVGREAMVNAFLHASASEIEVEFSKTEVSYDVVVTDDGTGITASERTDHPGHLGMQAMRDRTVEARGHLEIGPNHPTGTRVQLRIPRAISLVDPDAHSGSQREGDAHPDRQRRESHA